MIDGGGETCLFVILPAENLDHAVALYRFFQHMRDTPHGGLRAAAYAANAAADQAHDKRDQRGDGERDQRELRGNRCPIGESD